MSDRESIDLLSLREALEASWNEQTANLGVKMHGNPALGQCYPTARVIQYFTPETEIIIGIVWNGDEDEIHFWNGLIVNKNLYHIDFTWQQFPFGSIVKEFHLLDRNSLGDSPKTIERVELLKQKVLTYLNNQ